MSGSDTRRGFLRGLASLPLIGGGVALVGAPTAVAVEPSVSLMANYAAWLGSEERILRWELSKATGIPLAQMSRMAMADGDFHWPKGRPWYEEPMPSTRAALVLATVGAPTDVERDYIGWNSTPLI